MARVRFPGWELFGRLYDGSGLIVKRLRRGILNSSTACLVVDNSPEAWVQLPVRPFLGTRVSSSVNNSVVECGFSKPLTWVRFPVNAILFGFYMKTIRRSQRVVKSKLNRVLKIEKIFCSLGEQAEKPTKVPSSK